MQKKIISTEEAPAAIGAYSQAVRVENVVYLSGQIPLDPVTMDVIEGDFEEQVIQVFNNLLAVAAAAGGSLDDIVKLTIYLTDLNDFASLNEVMAEVWNEPYPARACVEVSALPKGVQVEMDAIMVLAN
jgi:reactive intermediate/imine deaminase